MQGFLIILPLRSNISKSQISLCKEKKHGHVDCLFLFAQDHNPKSKEAKMNHKKEEFSHPLGNCGYHPLDKAVTPC